MAEKKKIVNLWKRILMRTAVELKQILTDIVRGAELLFTEVQHIMMKPVRIHRKR